MRNNLTIWAANIGMLIILAAAALPLLRFGGDYWRYIFAVGAAIVLFARFFQPKDAPNLRARRLKKMEMWSAIVWVVGVFFIFYPKAGQTDWLAFFLAGGVLEAYASLMLPSAIKAGPDDDSSSTKSGKKKKK